MKKKLSVRSMRNIHAGNTSCLTAIALTTVAASLFGGVGAILGAGVAITGPKCLDWW